jgi:hypothetical protein
MRRNPLVTELFSGLLRVGYAQFYCLGLLLLQACVLFVYWPKDGVAELLASQASPHALSAVVMALGAALAYFALRIGSEEILLPGQHGLRDWALATELSLGRIMRGYLLGQIVHSIHLALLSSPLILMAFTVSGGEWAALLWCVAAALIQALFYRLCGAITHLTLGHHVGASLFTVRTIMVVIYALLGWFVPQLSHPWLTYHALEETVPATIGDPLAPRALSFLAIYGGLAMLLSVLVYILLRRERGRLAESVQHTLPAKRTP